MPEVIAVAAVDGSNAHSSVSNTGPETEVSAPGDGAGVVTTSFQIPGAYPWYDLTFSGGTSAATAYVAGVAALVRSYNPSWNNAYVRRRIRETTTCLGASNTFGSGLVNGYRAVTAYVP
jgi:subtilisin family serine protease